MNRIQKRSSRRSASAMAAGGLVLAGGALGAAFCALGGSASPQKALAGEHNYVVSVSHDAVSGVRLDEEVTIRFASGVLPSSVGPDTILIRTGANNGQQARGRYVVGKFMYDRATQRRVVIRPEAVQEYFQLIRGFSRADAKRKAKRYIDQIERTGRFQRLAKIDRGLRSRFPAGAGAGTRLDDEGVLATYPSQILDPNDPLVPYRASIAGDDALWEAHFGGDPAAFDQLASNSEFERFFHPVDPATGVQDADSVLRSRQYRQVLNDRRSDSRVIFVPDIPIRADLTDTGFASAAAYSVIVPTGQPGVFNTVLTRRGRRLLLQKDGRDFSTLFTTLPNTGGANLFQDNEARTGVAAQQAPRVVNVTPPNAESFVEPSTDWEDPDNINVTPVAARRTFSVRMRFAQPLDPRSVSPTNFTLVKIKSAPDTPNEVVFDPPIPVAVGTFLNQKRLGIVEVEITPATNLDPESAYQVIAKGLVKSLGGEFLGVDTKAIFNTGTGNPPLDKIFISFDDDSYRSNPNDPLNAGEVTTAQFPAPPLYDPQGRGLLVAAFLPFVGTGVGVPQDPQALPDPIANPIVTDLALAPPDNATITFLTEGSDPGDPANFGELIEFHYRSVFMQSATARAIGKHPLVIRSQTTFEMTNSAILASGAAGGTGRENVDIVLDGPTGGLGGTAGPGGHRGGDGAYAPETDFDGNPVTGIGGAFNFDPTKTDGADGAPGYQFQGPLTGGGGSGGFSGRREEGATVEVDGQPPVDPHLSPQRISESGGGGGHATVGTNGGGARLTTNTHPGGHLGGVGGQAYGQANFSDQGLNSALVPRLEFGSGGAGGGGGGGEDEPDSGGAQLTVGPEDSGGGAGGGGGGAVHITARDEFRMTSSVIDASGGKGGDTADAANADLGQGAGGGGAAGGAVWIQCFGEILVLNGSTITTAGGLGGEGEISPDPTNTNPPTTTGVITGFGGQGGIGFVRFEDVNGQADLTGSVVFGVVTQDMMTPAANGSYPSHKDVELLEFGDVPGDFNVLGVPFVTNKSVAYTRWISTDLDTPKLFPVVDDPNTPQVEGTIVDLGTTAAVVDILVRSAPNDTAATGRPNLFLVTPWVPLANAGDVSDRRFVQLQVQFTVPFSFTFDQTLPSVDQIHIDIELN